MTIGDRIREERKRLGLNQTEFSSLGGVVKFTQINYEKDERSPDTAYLSKLSEVGVDAYYILTGKRVSSPPSDLVAPLSQRLESLISTEQHKGTPDAILLHELLVAASKLAVKAAKASS